MLATKAVTSSCSLGAGGSTSALAAASLPDQLQMARLKRRKLRLRDEIAMLEDQLIPDIIA